MKNIISSVFAFLLLPVLYADMPFNYRVNLKSFTIDSLPGLHSFAFAQSDGKWLIVGGRTDGLHARQPFNAFTEAGNNSNIYVVDIKSRKRWTVSINSFPIALKEQLQSTNMNFIQSEDTLYLIGGYGYSPSSSGHITYPYLTTIVVSKLINAVIYGLPVQSCFKQINDQKFAVTGGQLGKIGDMFYLIGGNRFDGRYNPMGNPTYTQIYTDGLQKFRINNSGSVISFSDYSVVNDPQHLHRRDYNLLPQIFPNGEFGYTVYSGVFQKNVNLPFLYPVDIKAGGPVAITSFSQFLSNYHSAGAALYDSSHNSMHSIFFGGISRYYMKDTILTEDINVPFVKSISVVSRNSLGELEELVLKSEMPGFYGASAEFIINNSLPHIGDKIIRISDNSPDSLLIGYIFGGIFSPELNPFSNNNTGVTYASRNVFEVWLIKNQSAGLVVLNGKNPMKTSVFPNPANKNIRLKIEIPRPGKLRYVVSDISGRKVFDFTENDVPEGIHFFEFGEQPGFKKGIYQITIIYNYRFVSTENLEIGI